VLNPNLKSNAPFCLGVLLERRERKVKARYAVLTSHFAFEPLFCLAGQWQREAGGREPRQDTEVEVVNAGPEDAGNG